VCVSAKPLVDVKISLRLLYRFQSLSLQEIIKKVANVDIYSVF